MHVTSRRLLLAPGHAVKPSAKRALAATPSHLKHFTLPWHGRLQGRRSQRLCSGNPGGGRWTAEEETVLEAALKDVMQRAGAGFTVKEVAEKFRELDPSTGRQYKGIAEKTKRRMYAASREEGWALQPGSAAALAARDAAAAKVAPPISALQMVLEIVSCMPDMQATRDQVFDAVCTHPIYAHQLNWETSGGNRLVYSWQETVQRVVSNSKGAFTSYGPHKAAAAYACDPTKIPHTLKLWKSAPLVLASLLATYLPQNQATAEDLAGAILGHPFYSKVMRSEAPMLRSDRVPQWLVEKVEKVLEQHPDLFTRVPGEKGYTGPPLYAAVVKPFVYPN